MTRLTKCNATYDHWFREIDARCLQRLGLSVHDLSDYCWRDRFEEGYTPAQALATALREGLAE